MANTPSPIDIVRSDLGSLSKLETFDLRNGEVNTAVSLITKAAIPAAYKWRPIDALPANMSVAHTELFIKSAAITIGSNPQTGWSSAKNRKAAIILGTVRALVTEFYVLAPGDLIPGETEPWAIRYVPAATAGGEATCVSAHGLNAEQLEYLRSDLALTVPEREVMADLVMCAIGLPAVQGASLMETGHHYLSDVRGKSKAMFDVIEKQFWKKEPTRTWFTDDKEDMQDLMWHKACHPISISLKLKVATDPTVAEKIRIAGAGSAASRLPAKESVLRAAETAKTLMINVRPFFESFNGVLNCDLLTAAIDVTLGYIPMSNERDGTGAILPGVEMDILKGTVIPEWVKNRTTAITDSLLTRNTDSIAMAYGFYDALTESSMLTATTTDAQALGSAYSLRKLKTQCFAAYMLGREAHADYRAFKAQKGAAGEYNPPEAVIR